MFMCYLSLDFLLTVLVSSVLNLTKDCASAFHHGIVCLSRNEERLGW